MERFSSFFLSRTRDATATFGGYMRGLFQSERANMLRMSEVNAVDHQAMQHLLTEGAVDWDGFCDQIAQDTDALLGGPQSVWVIDKERLCQKGRGFGRGGPAVEWPPGQGGQLPGRCVRDAVPAREG